MKRTLMVLGVAAAVLTSQNVLAQGETIPLAEARAQIGAIVEDPASMTGVMRQLSPEDQLSLLSDVNSAIASMPGSSEEKVAKFLNVNRAALKGSAKGNLANLVAEVFATVPPEALTVINERFAADVFNRSADPSRTYTDDEILNISTNLMAKIESRTAGTDDAAVRNTFAIAMLVKASNGSPSNLSEALVSMLPEGNERDLAKNEWLPAALSEPADYESMLAYAGDGRQPSPEVAQLLAGPQLIEYLLADVASCLVDEQGRDTTPFSDMLLPLEDRVPRTEDLSKKWNPKYRRGELPKTVVVPEPEPILYP